MALPSAMRSRTFDISLPWLTRSKNFSRSILHDRLMGAFLWPKAVACGRKAPIPLALQLLHDSLIDETIQHRGNTWLSYSPSGLRNLHPSHRIGLVLTIQ